MISLYFMGLSRSISFPNRLLRCLLQMATKFGPVYGSNRKCSFGALSFLKAKLTLGLVFRGCELYMQNVYKLTIYFPSASLLFHLYDSDIDLQIESMRFKSKLFL